MTPPPPYMAPRTVRSYTVALPRTASVSMLASPLTVSPDWNVA